MLQINDLDTVRFLAEDRHRTYHPLPRRSLRRAARRAAAADTRHRS
jgi:hypothetical protein